MRITDLVVRPDSILKLVDKFEKAIDESMEALKLEGKTLAEVNKEQPVLMYRYSTLLAECDNTVKYLDSVVSKTRSEIFQRLHKTSDRNLTDRIIDKYVDAEQSYLDNLHLYLEIKAMRDKLAAVVEALRSRSWAIKHLVDLRINSLEHGVI